jgi:hypothetical protein
MLESSVSLPQISTRTWGSAQRRVLETPASPSSLFNPKRAMQSSDYVSCLATNTPPSSLCHSTTPQAVGLDAPELNSFAQPDFTEENIPKSRKYWTFYYLSCLCIQSALFPPSLRPTRQARTSTLAPLEDSPSRLFMIFIVFKLRNADTR